MFSKRGIVFIFLAVTTAFILGRCVFSAGVQSINFEPSLDPRDPSFQRLMARTKIEKEAMTLVKNGQYDAAITRYQDALDDSLIQYDYDRSMALAMATRLYQLQGKIDLAVKSLHKFNQSTLPNDFYKTTEPELQAVIAASEQRSKLPIYKHIDWLWKEYGLSLPPNKVRGGAASDIIRLYDYLEDYNEGIKFVDKALKYQGLKEKPRAEFLKIRRAFEESEAGMPKICGDGGKTCIGRATHALIQSDYFPW